MSACRSCSAPIRWARTVKGSLVPLDPEPSERGNLVLTGKTVQGRAGEVPQVRYLDPDTLPGLEPPERFLAHFVTCPDAASWRKQP